MTRIQASKEQSKRFIVKTLAYYNAWACFGAETRVVRGRSHLYDVRILHGDVIGVLHLHLAYGVALQQRGRVQLDVVRGRREEPTGYHLDVLQGPVVYVPLITRLRV